MRKTPRPSLCHPAKYDFARGKCAPCYNRARRLKDPERRKREDRNYWRRNRDRLIALRKVRLSSPEMRERVRRQSAASERRHPETRKRCYLRKTYGITLEDYRRMVELQGGSCAICRDELPGRHIAGKGPDVDHDHATGLVRSILCRDCNYAIGRLHDSPSRADAVAVYLRKHGRV
jgi:hypothetical protein